MRTFFLRRAAALLLALVCCLSVLPAVAEIYPLSGYVTTSLNLRQQPSASAKVVLTIPSGDMALITGESGNYYVVTYEGKQGYALKQYFRVVDSGISLPAVTPAPEEAGAGSYEVLYSGSQGDAVTALQSALKELGFYSGKTDGEFGSGTRSAVTAFQAKNGLSQTGGADAATQALLYEGKPKNSKGKATQVKTVSTVPGAEIKKDSIGPAVVKLQVRLKELGYYTGAADGTAAVHGIPGVQKLLPVRPDRVQMRFVRRDQPKSFVFIHGNPSLSVSIIHGFSFAVKYASKDDARRGVSRLPSSAPSPSGGRRSR